MRRFWRAVVGRRSFEGGPAPDQTRPDQTRVGEKQRFREAADAGFQQMGSARCRELTRNGPQADGGQRGHARESCSSRIGTVRSIMGSGKSAKGPQASKQERRGPWSVVWVAAGGPRHGLGQLRLGVAAGINGGGGPVALSAMEGQRQR